MFDGPFDGEAQCTLRQISDDDFERSDIDLRFVFSIHCVEMGRRVFTPEHLDDDTEKLADGRHDFAGCPLMRSC